MNGKDWLVKNLGTVEIGGTKTLVAVGDAEGTIERKIRLDTSEDAGFTMAAVAEILGKADVGAVGIAAFGPLELRQDHERFGEISATPKPGWSGIDVLGLVRREVDVPVGIETDVNAAALAEGKWGAAAGLSNHVYITVGTGVGFGIVTSGSLLMGTAHPEMGHTPVAARDPYQGSCPFHGGCLEGMISGPAIAGRFGVPPPELTETQAVVAAGLVGAYLGQALRTLAYSVAPQRVVIGGGIANLPDLHQSVHESFLEELGGYRQLDEYERQDFVVPPDLEDSGLSGGLILAERALG